MLQPSCVTEIRITHYINPHCFWYKPEIAYMQDHEQVKFATEVHDHCSREFGTRNEVVRKQQIANLRQPGELVALRNNKLDRWIRCVVEEVVVDLTETIWYQLWAMDEGFPIKSGDRYVRPLPEVFKQEPAHAKRGSLMNLLPAAMRYDYLTQRQILEPQSRWCPGIVHALEGLLNEAHTIRIQQKAKLALQCGEMVYVNEMFITTVCSDSCNVVDVLSTACSDQMVKVPDDYFLKAVQALPSLNMKRYLDNEGIDRMPNTVNNFDSSTIRKPNQPALKPAQVVPEVQRKILDWWNRNKMASLVEIRRQRAEDEQTNLETVTYNVPTNIQETTSATESSMCAITPATNVQKYHPVSAEEVKTEPRVPTRSPSPPLPVHCPHKTFKKTRHCRTKEVDGDKHWPSIIPEACSSMFLKSLMQTHGRNDGE